MEDLGSLRGEAAELAPSANPRRAFIKAVLPRLAYANPSIPIDVTFITSRARSESTPQPTESGSEISAQASSQATENEISREIASVTLEFGECQPLVVDDFLQIQTDPLTSTSSFAAPRLCQQTMDCLLAKSS